MHRTLRLFSVFALGLFSNAPLAHAAPLAGNNVPQDAQWVLHLDADGMRSTRTGQALIRQLSEREIGQFDEALPIDPVLLLNGLRSVTLSGTNLDFREEGNRQRGVVLLEGTPELVQIVQGAIAALQLNEPERAQVVEESPELVYAIDGEFFASVLDERRIVLGNALAEVKKLIAVQRGEQAHANLERRFQSRVVADRDAFFLSFLAEGIDQAQGLPPQARVLQMTEGVGLQLREDAESLHLATSLTTGTEGVARQVQQVLQGLVAMFSLAQRSDADVSLLVQSARVSSSDRTVRLELRYPVERAVQWTARLADEAEATVREAAQTPLSMPPEAVE